MFILFDKTTKLVRDKSLKALKELKTDLNQQNWDEVYVNDVNIAYDSFMIILKRLYDKNCKIRSLTKKNIIDKPWMTKGLHNACKKKNYLYRCFLKLRTKEAENRYKKYKNKLVSITRIHKK